MMIPDSNRGAVQQCGGQSARTAWLQDLRARPDMLLEEISKSPVQTGRRRNLGMPKPTGKTHRDTTSDDQRISAVG